MSSPQEYIKFGWYIFPCHSIEKGKCTCSKKDCNSPGKHPRTTNGVKDASNDIAVIENWQKIWPDCNWGLSCGRESNAVVIDIDQRKGGLDSFDEYEESRPHGPLPFSLRAVSGGGGRHLVFSYPNDGHAVKNRVGWLPGVDIRSDGGYVILAPGTHISGGRYAWNNWGAQLAPLPNDVATSVRLSATGSQHAKDGLKDAQNILAGVPEGARDDTLFKWACRLRRLHAGDSDGGRAVVTALVLEAARNSDFPEDQARAKVEQAFKQEHDENVDVMDWVTAQTADGEIVLHNLTDVGNRNRFIDLHGDDLRYVPEMGWFQWTEQGWIKVPIEYIMGLAEGVSPVLLEEAEIIDDNTVRRQWKRWARESENRSRLSNIEALARSHPTVLRAADAFDSSLTELACKNGIVDLKTGSIRPFEREDLFTKNTGIDYDPSATLPEWDRFVAECVQGDADLAEYLQRAAGYTATGLNTQECFFIVTGPPSSGKSTYLDAVSSALGEYEASSQSDTFMYRRGKDSPKEEIARLRGMRMTTVSEIREGDIFNEQLVKQITGGDKISARFLYHDTFEFRPQFKIWIGTNHDPASSDQGILRRIKRIQFTHVVPPEKRDVRLKLLVKDPNKGSPAILNWIVQGAMTFLKDMSLNEPAGITLAVEMYRMENDILQTFINENTNVADERWCWASDIFAVWSEWCKQRNERAGRPYAFKQRMIEKGYEYVIADIERKEYIKGISVKSVTEAFSSWAN